MRHARTFEKGIEFDWNPQCQKVFEKIKDILTTPHVLLPPISRKPLLLYITTSKKSVGALVAQEREGIEKPMYYLSCLIRGVERNYSIIEKQCLALAYVAQRLRH